MKKVLFLVLIISTSVSASTETKKLMRNVLESYLELLPQIYGEKDKTKLKKGLVKLQDSFEKAGHNKMLKRANFSPSVKIIKNTFDEIDNSIDDNYDWARYRAKKVVSTCISCHSQLPNTLYPKVKTKYSKLIKKHVNTNFERGQLAYMLRDYKSAIGYLEKEMSSKKQNQEEITKTILKIYLVNLNDPKGAKKFLFKIQNLAGLDKQAMRAAKVWYESINTKSSEKDNLSIAIKKNLMPIEKEITSSYIHENDVNIFKMQSKLNNFAVKNPRSEKMPEVLYWLGLIENRSDTVYLSSLGDMYLKECVNNYSKSKYAKKCFKAYEDSISFSFSGSAGMSIPKEVKAELQKLRNKIQ
jgi:hypothetical protein